MPKYPVFIVEETSKFRLGAHSRLETRIGPLLIDIKIGGAASPRTRRSVLLTVLRQITKVLGHLPLAHISSTEVPNWGTTSFDQRRASIHQAPGISAIPEKQGFRLRLRRNEAELTQAQLAEKVGIGRTYLCEIERGRQNPSPELLQKIDRVLILTKDEGRKG